MNVDQPRVAAGLVAPHAREQVISREHAAWLTGERAQELELCRL
jgi:hypothetical protein